MKLTQERIDRMIEDSVGTEQFYAVHELARAVVGLKAQRDELLAWAQKMIDSLNSSTAHVFAIASKGTDLIARCKEAELER